MHELPANIQNDPELKRKNIKVALPLEASIYSGRVAYGTSVSTGRQARGWKWGFLQRDANYRT